MSASRMATNDTSGRSRPSRNKLMPTSTSKSPSRRSRSISIRWIVSTSEWRYLTRIPCSSRYSVRSSAIFLVRVVTRVRWSASTRAAIISRRSSICPLVGRTCTSGSIRPVGRTICSTTRLLFSNSQPPGVAETRRTCPTRSTNSSKRSGRLSAAEGRRKPCSMRVAFRLRSASYCPWSCGTATCDSSSTTRKSSGK